ncbi:MAG: hypothetical protein NDI61_07955 [Bdellovibrionaceae bacterium]|nr:hypothetical protein [Pseudobdellovibrionaceae bacterium]
MKSDKPKSKVTAQINAKQTSVLKEPIAGSMMIDTLAKGKKVRVLQDTDDGYTQIVFKDSFGVVQKGWVESHRVSRSRQAAPVANQAEPIDSEFEAEEQEKQKENSRADEWALATPSLFYVNEWPIAFQPRRWRPMAATQFLFRSESFKAKLSDTELGDVRTTRAMTFMHLGMGLGRRNSVYLTLPQEARAEKEEFTDGTNESRHTGLAEIQVRAIHLLFDRTSRNNAQLGVLYSPAGTLKYSTGGVVNSSTRGRSLVGFLLSYFDYTSSDGFSAILDIRAYGEAKNYPNRSSTEKAYSDVALGGTYRFNDGDFISDVGYLLQLRSPLATADSAGDTVDLTISPQHRFFADARYVFSGAFTVSAAAAALVGGIRTYSDGIELNPNVGLQFGLGLQYSF